MKKIMFNDKYGLTAAVLNGKKTMTRRIIKAPRRNIEGKEVCGFAINKTPAGVPYEVWLTGPDEESLCQLLPTYKVGEVVAVAQAYKDIIGDHVFFVSSETGVSVHRAVMEREKGWTNKMFVTAEFMPHHIRITDIKVERLQNISKEDCLREGIEEDSAEGLLLYWWSVPHEGISWEEYKKRSYELARHELNGKTGSYFWDTPQGAFAALIDKVSGKGTWESNPWVIAYTFELID